MAFGLFVYRFDSIYDDSPAERYQFPSQYLDRAQACLDDWIIFYEPRKVIATRGYFAVAKVQEIVLDPTTPGMYFAIIQPGSYLDFANPIPFNGPDGVIESGVLNQLGRISGRAQSSVRPLSPADFRRIVEIGLTENLILPPRIDAPSAQLGLREDQAGFEYEQDRVRAEVLTSRLMRDRVFRQVVLRAYGSRCAVSGLKLINGGGRPEVEAAHIRSVEANGPDTVTNGLALSGTAHWMFDRGLISISDDLKLLVSRHINDPEAAASIINRTGSVIGPLRETDRPHPHFLAWHRENRFKA